MPGIKYLPFVYLYCMNTFRGITAFILFFVLAGCKNQGESTTPKQFYPLQGFVEGQLNYLDSVPLAIIHYTTVNNHTDTAIAEKKQFRDYIGQEFIQSDISAEERKKNYTETSFIDATIGAITLTYTPEKSAPDLAVKKIDILLKHENSAVSTVYIEKVVTGGDSTVLKKMLWTAYKNCQVTSIIQKSNEPDKIVQERFVWDN